MMSLKFDVICQNPDLRDWELWMFRLANEIIERTK